eukprot:2008989-Alexandrium_andersonii.AAC.1
MRPDQSHLLVRSWAGQQAVSCERQDARKSGVSTWQCCHVELAEVACWLEFGRGGGLDLNVRASF